MQQRISTLRQRIVSARGCYQGFVWSRRRLNQLTSFPLEWKVSIAMGALIDCRLINNRSP